MHAFVHLLFFSPLCSSFCSKLRSAVLSWPSCSGFCFCCANCCCCLLFGKSTLLCSPICLQAVVLQILPWSSCFAPLPTLLGCRLWGSPLLKLSISNTRCPTDSCMLMLWLVVACSCSSDQASSKALRYCNEEAGWEQSLGKAGAPPGPNGLGDLLACLPVSAHVFQDHGEVQAWTFIQNTTRRCLDVAPSLHGWYPVALGWPPKKKLLDAHQITDAMALLPCWAEEKFPFLEEASGKSWATSCGKTFQGEAEQGKLGA